jgi:hypothetical protein
MKKSEPEREIYSDGQECEMVNAECGMRNDKKQAAFNSSFIIPHSSFHIPPSIRPAAFAEFGFSPEASEEFEARRGRVAFVVVRRE